MKNNYKTKKGFTLVELILYIAISSIILLSVSTLISFLLESQVKNRAIMSVEQQGAYITQLITQNIRNAQSIEAPTPGNENSQIDINLRYVSEFDYHTTSFFINGYTLSQGESIQQPNSGSSWNTVLNNPDIEIKQLVFKNVSIENTPDSISFEFIVSYKNNNNRNEYNYSKKFYGGASLRKKNEL